MHKNLNTLIHFGRFNSILQVRIEKIAEMIAEKIARRSWKNLKRAMKLFSICKHLKLSQWGFRLEIAG